MAVEHNQRAGQGAKHYKIVVRGELSERFEPEFKGMSLVAENGRTALVGEVVDQSHLHELLDRLSYFGLKLLSVNALSGREGG